MKNKYLILLLLLLFQNVFGQVYEWKNNEFGFTHKIQMDSNYIIETVYKNNPTQFISTRGGFYESNNDVLNIKFEFNSNYSNDSIVEIEYIIPAKAKNVSNSKLELDGKWLMAGRVNPDGKEMRRDTSRSRKTLKFLVDGFFQWTAFNTETFQFYGCGGGKYSASEGEYKESIVYFSRDNSRSGKTLKFNYKKNENDWYHNGFSSKGKPLHEIWTLRITK